MRVYIYIHLYIYIDTHIYNHIYVYLPIYIYMIRHKNPGNTKQRCGHWFVEIYGNG